MFLIDVLVEPASGGQPFSYRLALRPFGFSSGGQLNDEHEIIGLNLGFMSGAATADLAAFSAFGYDDITLFRVWFGRDRLQITAAGISAVTRVDINVARPQAEWTMVAGGIAQGLDLAAAVDTGKSIV